MDYTTLTGDKSVAGSIKSWLNYGKVDSAGVVLEAEGLIYQKLRVREMRASYQAAVAVDASSSTLPTGFLDPIKVRDITNDYDLNPRSEEDIEGLRTWTSGTLDSGDPMFFGIFDEAFQFDCRTATAWTLRAVFYKKLDPLSDTNPTNFLTSRYPHVLRMACLATAARFSNDDDTWAREQRLLEATIDDLNMADELSRRGQENPVR